MLLPKIDKNVATVETQDFYEVEVETLYDFENFYDYDFLTEEKERQKFVKVIEKIVRSSFEYRNYIGLLKNELNLTKCTFFPMVDIKEIKGISLEMHHYPYTLYDITSIVLDEHIVTRKEKQINPFQIADEIMQLHYRNYIGLVPLSKTVHDLAHEGLMFINLKYVYGNYMKFVNMYEAANNEVYKNQLDGLHTLSKTEDEQGELITGSILKKNMMKLNIKDRDKLEAIPYEPEEDALFA